MDSSLSIVPSEGNSNEFPVLKAFQEYIDAEQAKARKRMLGLSVFFIILLLVVVVTFVLVLTTMVNRNQALSDRLLDYALKEREKTPQVVVQQPQPAAVAAQPATPQPSIQDILKPFLERLEREQAAMKELYEKRQVEYEKQQKEQAKQQKEAEARATAREKAREEEMRKARAELEKERARMQRENDRQAEIERHRRRLYPEYYRDQGQTSQPPSAPSSPPSAPRQQPVGAQSTSPSSTASASPVKPAPKQATAPAPTPPTQKPAAAPQPAPTAKKTPSLSNIKPVTYFNTDDDDGVPFLLETPQKQHQK